MKEDQHSGFEKSSMKALHSFYIMEQVLKSTCLLYQLFYKLIHSSDFKKVNLSSTSISVFCSKINLFVKALLNFEEKVRI